MYEAHFGFSAKPFQLTPDPQFFYASACHKKALYYLQYGLHQGEGFIVITGPIGTGKSTLASSLLDSIESEDIVATQVSTSNLTPKELLEHISNAFGLSSKGDSKAQILRHIEDYLFRLSHQNKRALLIIDEAQNLDHDSLEELRLLSNYQVNNKPLLQTFLLGQEELRGKLQHPSMLQFQQRVIASFHLRALNENEVKQYIMHRLLQVGWTDKPAFTEQALTRLHQYTMGIPRRINIFMDRTLLMSFLESNDLVDSKVIESVGEELREELKQGNTSESSHDDTEEDTPQTEADDHGHPVNSDVSRHDLEGLLQDFNEILESALEQKIAYTKFKNSPAGKEGISQL